MIETITQYFSNAKTIAEPVLAFCRQHVGKRFHAADLKKWVTNRVPAAPGSPDRILRQLRLEGKVHYRVVNRRQSLYEIQGVT